MRNKWPARFLTLRAPLHNSFPTLMSLSGQSASPETKCAAVGQLDMSRPTSLNNGKAFPLSLNLLTQPTPELYAIQ